MPPYLIKSAGGLVPLLVDDGAGNLYPTQDEDCCICKGGIDACCCTGLPETLFVRDAADGSLIAVITYVDALENIIGTPPGWEGPFAGGTLEFYCDPATGDTWVYDDEEGGSYNQPCTDCIGTLATFDGVATGSGTIYVSTN